MAPTAKRRDEPTNRWESLAISIQEALEETTHTLPLKVMSANISSYMGEGRWRKKPFYMGDTFDIIGARVGSKQNLLFRMKPINKLTGLAVGSGPLHVSEYESSGLEYCEADISQMNHLFGEWEFDEFCKSALGCSMQEAFDKVGMVVNKEDFAPKDANGKLIPQVKLQEMQDFGDW